MPGITRNQCSIHRFSRPPRVTGDLRVDGIVFNLDGSNMQTKASPWSFSSFDIYYNGGNVGIGIIPAPANKLDVNGNVNVKGTVNACQQRV